MRVWISERVSGLSELKANKSPERPPSPASSLCRRNKSRRQRCVRGCWVLSTRDKHIGACVPLIINWFLWATRCSLLWKTICKNRLHNNRQDRRSNHDVMKQSPRLENNESSKARGAVKLHRCSENTSLSQSTAESLSCRTCRPCSLEGRRLNLSASSSSEEGQHVFKMIVLVL